MKRYFLAIGALCLAVSLAYFDNPAAAFGQSDKAADVTLKGEVVDLHCYVTRGAKGADHAACANSCISRGVSAGFLAEDGKLYMLFESKPVSVKDSVANLAGKQSRLTGTLVERDGVKAIVLKSIEPLGED